MTQKPEQTKQGKEAMDNVESKWELIDAYFYPNPMKQLVRHQLESYNYFACTQLANTIQMFNPRKIKESLGTSVIEMTISFENFQIFRPNIYENSGAVKLMFPHEARLRNLIYASLTTVDIHVNTHITTITGDGKERKECFQSVLPEIQIGKIPIMVGSSLCVLNQYSFMEANKNGECTQDAGGYFIINGSEKVILGQERAAENKVACYNIAKTDNKYHWKAEIKSVPMNKCISPKCIFVYMSSKNNGFGFPIVVELPRIKSMIPLWILFRALGITSDRDICEKMVDIHDSTQTNLLEMLEASIIESNTIYTQEDAIVYLINLVSFSIKHPEELDKMDELYETKLQTRVSGDYEKKRQFTIELLSTDLFPHCSTPDQKVNFLGHMVKRLLLTVSGLLPINDRDAYHNKRIDTPGMLLNNLYRNYFNRMVKDMEKQIVKEIKTGSWKSMNRFDQILNMTNIYKIIKPIQIENGLKTALATGNFGIKNTNSNKVGVAQVLNRLNMPSTISHLRRISMTTEKSGKLIPPRKLHSTCWGFLCPVETPEGGSVGIVKNLATMVVITTHSNVSSIYDCVLPHIVSDMDKHGSSLSVLSVRVFINGAIVGTTLDPQALFALLKSYKYRGVINIYTSIVFDYRWCEIRICNDAGRLVRPVLRVNPLTRTTYATQDTIDQLSNHLICWDNLLIETDADHPSIIEYIDPEEQEWSLIAMDTNTMKNNEMDKYTHCEIHPSTILGVLASCIPFPEHNQSPRNTYQCAQGKQAIGVYATNHATRMDKTSYVLEYPMRPLVETRIMNILEQNKMPSGTQMIVAIMTHTGYNQEDSLLINQGSINRGMAISSIYHTYSDEDKKRNNREIELYGKPDVNVTMGYKHENNYDKVNSDGVIPHNTLVEKRDILIAKSVPIKENKNDIHKQVKYEDHSISHKSADEEIYLEKNTRNRHGDGYRYSKVKLRSLRDPVLGDKFSSRHGQKGTIGNIISECDMPFLENGLKPDIILNPHAIPSRMTIGHLKETLLGTIALSHGVFGDGSPFGELTVNELCQEMRKIGYESNGNQLMYNGLTGEQMECSVFVGPVYYQRLKHMVKDKIHSRGNGRMVNFTRQPAEGRSRAGGLRFGEMERDCMISHGASRFTKERMYDVSDKFRVHLCKKCGFIAAYNEQYQLYKCRTCDNRTEFVEAQIPYSCKLLFQELQTMGIAPRLITEEA